jgi:ABC-type nitrate/sulfonate/bicarbonate transport system substrate-binding protein
MKIRLAAGSGPTFGVDDLACAAATHLGCWADEGLDVSWTSVRGGVAAIQAVMEDAVDVSYGGLGPILKYRSEGKPVRVIVSMARALAQNLVAQARIRKPADLRGASWAIDGVGALSHHMARLIVRNLNIPENEIDWKVLGPPPERIAGLLAGKVDVSLLRVEEAMSLHLDKGNTLHNLLGFTDLKTLVPVQPHGVLATSEDFEKKNPDMLLRLAKGMIRASRALNDDFSAFRKVYDHYVTVSLADEHVRSIWEQERASGGFAIDGELSEPHWRQQMKLFYELNPSMRKVSRDELIAHRFVEAALAELAGA